ncbi:uncharacterized protein BCR38DRAFT_439614 [Pseudomassariella vexata]|uniref:Uncharacterized protein n=1 Tax=Pseudomassariella vexata TaxID=1141098 RepID=A0A1Y2DPW6_9PEZI|nr:uncharacterized protein BCR38DRAFT_439614 [Pseudomassariella vexata]ORY61219.1 hypothetical protein BCR38DRAFT_439614 [Pseudomassariella vexata]
MLRHMHIEQFSFSIPEYTTNTQHWAPFTISQSVVTENDVLSFRVPGSVDFVYGLVRRWGISRILWDNWQQDVKRFG